MVSKPFHIHIWIIPRYIMYMTLGKIPISNPNVTFGLHSIICHPHVSNRPWPLVTTWGQSKRSEKKQPNKVSNHHVQLHSYLGIVNICIPFSASRILMLTRIMRPFIGQTQLCVCFDTNDRWGCTRPVNNYLSSILNWFQTEVHIIQIFIYVMGWDLGESWTIRNI